MTEKQKIFADEYLIDLNATRAYKVAYPKVKKDKTAAQAGSRMLRNVKVERYIQERMQARQERTEITQDRVLEELAAIAFARTTDYAEVKDGRVLLKNTENLNEQQIRAIAGIKDGKYGIEIKLNDKEKMIITKRFFDGRTQMEVADEIGISQAKVSRLEKNAIDHIKRLYK